MAGGVPGLISQSGSAGTPNFKFIELSNGNIPLNNRIADDYVLISTIGINEDGYASNKSREILYTLTVLPRKVKFPMNYYRLEVMNPVKGERNPLDPKDRLIAFRATYSKDQKYPMIKTIDVSEVEHLRKYIETDMINIFYRKLVNYLKVNSVVSFNRLILVVYPAEA